MKFDISLLFTLASGLWVVWNYFFKRSFAPKIKINISGVILGSDSLGQMILRTELTMENSGDVRFRARELMLTVRGIKEPIFSKGDDKILNQVLFNDKIYQDNLVPIEWGYTFIDPGVTQRYLHTILIPSEYKYLLLESKVTYSKSKDFQIGSFVLKIEDGNKI
jgi:hypothetical protein